MRSFKGDFLPSRRCTYFLHKDLAAQFWRKVHERWKKSWISLLHASPAVDKAGYILTETWIKTDSNLKNIYDDITKSRGLDFVYYNRPGKRKGGGVAIVFDRSKIVLEEVQLTPRTERCSDLWLAVQCVHLDPPVSWILIILKQKLLRQSFTSWTFYSVAFIFQHNITKLGESKETHTV